MSAGAWLFAFVAGWAVTAVFVSWLMGQATERADREEFPWR